MKINDQPQDFQIHSSFQSFTDRQKNVFDQLDSICTFNQASTNNTNMDVDGEQVSSTSPTLRRQNTKQFRGKESIFKKPLPPTPKFNRRVPDYQRNPHKWTKYTLEDVSNEEMSDRCNTTTAISFLNELASRQDQSSGETCTTTSSTKILYKKTIHVPVGKQCNDARTFQSSKMVMPEYVVGQKTKREHRLKSNSVRKVGLAKQLKLDDLEEQDDETGNRLKSNSVRKVGLAKQLKLDHLEEQDDETGNLDT